MERWKGASMVFAVDVPKGGWGWLGYLCRLLQDTPEMEIEAVKILKIG